MISSAAKSEDQTSRSNWSSLLSSFSRNYQIFAEIDALAKLRPDWDGYGGIAPSIEAIEQAKIFMAGLPENMARPAIEPSGDGEINLVWRSARAYLEVGFVDGTGYSFFGKSPPRVAKGEQQGRWFGDVPATANRLPMRLQWLMGQFANAEVFVRNAPAERERGFTGAY